MSSSLNFENNKLFTIYRYIDGYKIETYTDDILEMAMFNGQNQITFHSNSCHNNVKIKHLKW